MVRARIYIFFLLCISIDCDARGRHLPAPRRVNARVSSPYSIQVKWRDPGVRTRVKDGRRYFLRYTADVGFTNPTASENKTEDFEPGEGTLKEKIIRISKRRAKLYGLRPATTYKIDVKVTKGRRSSPWSDVIEVTTLEEEIDERMVQNVTAVAMSSSSVALSWIQPEVADDVMAYTVIVTPTNGRGRQRKVVIANNVTSHVISSLRPSQSYCFRVQSMKVVGPHPMSRPVIAKPLSARPSGAPHSLKLVPVNSSLVMVSWKPPNQRTRNGQLTGYKIAYKRKRSRKTDVQTVIVGKGQRNYQLGDLESNTTYKVRVAAQNINGTGPFTKWRPVYVKPEEASGNEIKNHTPMANIDLARSNSPIELLPSPPSDIKVINKTGSSLFLSWTVPVTPACCPLVAYRITVQNLNDSTVRKLMEESHHVHITDLRPNTRFGVSVTALNSVGESGTSERLLVSTAGFAAPRVTFIHAQAVHLGGHANLTCEAKGQEIPSIEWYTQSALGQVSIVNIRDTNLSISNRVAVASSVKGHNLRRSTLILHEVTQTAEREYTCLARNSVGSDEAKVQLILYEPPQIVRSDGAKVVEGQSARLVCEARGKPLPQIVWVHEKSRRVVEESNSRSATGIYTRSTSDQGALTRVSYLESRRASRKDAGQYLCVATSRQNQVYAHVTLDVQAPRPPAVSKIQTIALSPSRVSVTWLPPLNYSHGIEFYQVSYRKLRETGSVRYKNVTRVGTDLYGLDHDTDYLVGVIASSDSGLGEKGPEVKVTTLTNENLEPVNASVAAVNETMIRVVWDGPAHVSSLYIRGYNIYIRREREKKVEQRYVTSGEKQQFLFGGVKQDSVHYLRISTLMTWGFEAFSAWVKLQSEAAEFVPARPRGLRADADHNGITVSWLRPRGGVPVKGYIVAYNPARDPQFVERVRVAGTTSKVRLDKVKPLTEYILSVRAFNKFGESRAYRVKATTPSFAPSTVRHAQTLPVSPTEIHLKWEAPSGGHVTRYHIRYWRPGRREKQSAWMTGNFRNYVAGSLRKGSNYRFEIIPYNGAIPGAAVVMFASTPGDTPDGPPLDISLEAVNSSTLLASWQPPDQDLANGKVKGYRLVLKVKGGKRIYSFRLHGSRRNFTFYDMDTSMTHQLKIGAITVNGTGVMSPWIDSTYFGNPDRPGSPQNLMIEPNVTTIQMSWSRPQFTGSRVTGYIVGYGRFIPEVYRVVLPGTQESYRITGLSPNSRYIVSVRTFNIIGESQPSFRRVSTLKVPPVRAPLLAPSKLTVQSDSPTSLVVTWVDPAIVDKKQMLDGRRYLIRYSPMSGESYIYVEASNQTFRLADLDPATSYELSVKTLRGNSSSKWSLPIVDSTQQTIPSSAPWNVTVGQSGGNPTVLHLRWMKPEQPNGKIEEYFVYQSVNPFLNSKLWNVTATNQLEMKLREVIPYRTYYFRLQARNRVGYGPLSEVIVFKPKTDSRAVPSNVAVSSLGGNGSAAKVKVTWEPLKINTEGILGYVIQYFNLSSVGGRQHWEVVNSERELVGEVSGLRFGTTYSFKVCASFFTGRGLCSGIVNFTIPHSVFQTNDRPDAQNTTSQPRTRDYSLSTTEPSITSTDRPSRVWPLSTAQIPHLVLTSAGTQHQEKEDGQDAERILEKREMEGEMEKNETDADGKVENQEDDNASKDSEDVEILEKVTTKSSKYDVRDILPTNQSDTISNYEGGHNKSNVTKGGNVELYPEYKKSGTGHSHSLERQTTVFGKYAKTTDSVHDESERSNVKNVSEHFGNIRSFPVERDKNTSSFPFEDQDLDPEGSEGERFRLWR